MRLCLVFTDPVKYHELVYHEVYNSLDAVIISCLYHNTAVIFWIKTLQQVVSLGTFLGRLIQETSIC